MENDSGPEIDPWEMAEESEGVEKNRCLYLNIFLLLSADRAGD